MAVDTVVYIFDLLGIAVFAVSGALAAAEKRLDVLGFVLFGTITGIGGGTVRDLLLQTDQVFWIGNTTYLWVCIGASLATWFLAHLFESLRALLLWADALGLALFSVLGTQKALAWDAPLLVAVGMGMMTATFGSLIRDSLLGRPPVLLEPDIYVSAAALGALSYVAIVAQDWGREVALPVAVAAAFALRAGAILFDLRLPKYRPRDPRRNTHVP
ncbi:trimeric intracellular cation channel family protein [Kineobactrum salinum]|uniref:Trimeric intracellular cation channel family protein n=1 Tax=Kineobactrum salinum TaxID=2708301 RepID=A0A6C0U9T4_9GAMM|nr:trimeric intracellular cation channel family protein [Kineobactrum salinum]QIB67445.1 trimeric intracellular cation channel family protein [Kineobactrum salinum]